MPSGPQSKSQSQSQSWSPGDPPTTRGLDQHLQDRPSPVSCPRRRGTGHPVSHCLSLAVCCCCCCYCYCCSPVACACACVYLTSSPINPFLPLPLRESPLPLSPHTRGKVPRYTHTPRLPVQVPSTSPSKCLVPVSPVPFYHHHHHLLSLEPFHPTLNYFHPLPLPIRFLTFLTYSPNSSPALHAHLLPTKPFFFPFTRRVPMFPF